MTVFAGDTIDATDVNLAPFGVTIKRARRTTAKTGITTTETPVLRLDDIPVKAGYLYGIMINNTTVDTTIAADVGAPRIRYVYSATTGTLATITDTQIGNMRAYQGNPTDSTNLCGLTFYMASATGYISVLLTLLRTQGTGSFQWFASGTEPLDLIIFEMGVDPGDTGVVL